MRRQSKRNRTFVFRVAEWYGTVRCGVAWVTYERTHSVAGTFEDVRMMLTPLCTAAVLWSWPALWASEQSWELLAEFAELFPNYDVFECVAQIREPRQFV